MPGYHSELINPPPEVQSAMSALVQTCRAWTPTMVPDAPPPVPAPVHRELTAAQLCNFVADPDAGLWFLFYLGAGTSVLLLVVTWSLGLHRIPALLWRLATRSVRRARSA